MPVLRLADGGQVRTVRMEARGMTLEELLAKIAETNKQYRALADELRREHDIVLCGLSDNEIQIFSGIDKIPGRSWITIEADRYNAGTKVVQRNGMKWFQLGDPVEREWRYR